MLKETLKQIFISAIVFAVIIGGYYLYTHITCITPLRSCLFIGW